MSEYQRIAFRAIDSPVSDANLAYMQRQSTRAEITPWSFDNEYHYGDFGGNPVEMLRRGYDLHLHYANFGVRTLLIRLPYGFPDASAAKAYLSKDSPRFLKDKKGSGGVLAIEPCYDPDALEEIWDTDGILDQLVPLRAEILSGDLRPLYLAHLATACDSNHDPEKTKEALVPAGLEKPSDAQCELAEFYGLSEHLIAAAAQDSPALPSQLDARDGYAGWLLQQPQTTKDAWITHWMADPHSAARVEILAAFQATRKVRLWPTVRRDRTIAELEVAANLIRSEVDKRAAEKAALRRKRKLVDMAADPAGTLRETERLVEGRSVKNYLQIATLLADLREALAGTQKSELASKQAEKLRKGNPTLKQLTSALRGQGFLPK